MISYGLAIDADDLFRSLLKYQVVFSVAVDCKQYRRSKIPKFRNKI